MALLDGVNYIHNIASKLMNSKKPGFYGNLPLTVATLSDLSD
jgi:hypothetical protein